MPAVTLAGHGDMSAEHLAKPSTVDSQACAVMRQLVGFMQSHCTTLGHASAVMSLPSASVPSFQVIPVWPVKRAAD